MRGAWLAAAAAALAMTWAPTAAQDRTTRIPLLGRTLSFQLPAGFSLANNQNNGVNVLMEYTPRGETVATWTRLVTVQAYRGLGRTPKPTAVIAREAFYPAACRVGPIYRDGGEAVAGPGLKLSIIATGCASLPPGAYPAARAGAGE